MGYRSDVAIEMEEKSFELMKQKLLEFKKAQPEEWKYFKPSVVKNHSGTRFLISWEYVKWYENYPDVGVVEGVLGQLCKEHLEEAGWSFYFIRVGEDYDDVEHRMNNTGFCPNIYTSTTILGFNSDANVEL